MALFRYIVRHNSAGIHMTRSGRVVRLNIKIEFRLVPIVWVVIMEGIVIVASVPAMANGDVATLLAINTPSGRAWDFHKKPSPN